MATKEQGILDKMSRYAVGSPELSSLLQAGYPDMTEEKAEAIIKERKEKPESWPYAMFERAEAFLKALNTKPVAISKKPGWKRSRRGRGGDRG